MQRYNNNKRPLRKRPVRDRTVTTLTGNDDDQKVFSGPSAAGSHSVGFNDETPIFSSPVNAASHGNLQFNQLEVATSMPSNFGFGFNSFVGPMNPNNHSGKPQQNPTSYYSSQPTMMLPPGKSDLEILEKLKERIKKGQHEFYRATPMPELLAGLYLGSSQDLDAQENGPAPASVNGDVNVLNKALSSAPSALATSESSPSKNISLSTHQENGLSSKENGSKSSTSLPTSTTDSVHGLNSSMNPSLPAKPALTNDHGMNGSSYNKDERPSALGRETYPPSKDRDLSSSGASSLPSHSASQTASANKYYDPREHRNTRERDRDNRDKDRDKDYDSQRRRSSSVSASGAEYASVRYGPIRDIRDTKDIRRDVRDARRPPDVHYDNASYRREDYLHPPPPPPSAMEDYRRPPGPIVPQAPPSDRYARPPPVDDRYRHEDRYSERLAPPPPSQSSVPVTPSYGSYRPDDRERSRYDANNNSYSPNYHPSLNHPPHTGNTPPTRPTHMHNSLASRYNENRPQIGESPVAAAAAAEREQRERAAAEREQREKLEKERERERLGQRDMRPPPPPSQAHQVAPAKLEERLTTRAPTLQERLNHPPLTESRTLSLEERLSTHPKTSNTTVTNLPSTSGPPASPASSKGGSAAGSAVPPPPDSASSITSTTSGSTQRPSGAVAGSASAPNSAGAGPPASTSFTPAPSVTRDDGAVRERYPSPTLSDRERDRRMRTYTSPLPYDRDGDRDHRRAVSAGNGGPVGGREYIYDERDKERDRRRDWPPPGDDPYYRPSPPVMSTSSRLAPSIYPSPPPLPPSQGPSSLVDRYDRDSRINFRGPWEARDHERRVSASGVPPSVMATSASTSSPRSDVPLRGGGGGNGGAGIPIPLPIPMSHLPDPAADDRVRDRDRSYRPSPGLDSRYPPPPPPPGSSLPGTPAPYTHGRVRPRSPSPGPRGPPIKRPRDDMYSPLPSSSSAPFSSPSGYGNGPPGSSSVSRRSVEYPLPPPPMPLARDPYYDKYDKYDSRPPASNYPPPVPAGYDRPRSPRGAPYPGGYRDPRDVRDARDSRDVRDVRDIRDLRDPRDIRGDIRDIRDVRDPRDLRDMRDMRDPREMRDVRDVRDVRDMRDPREDSRRYSMPPPPLPR